MIKIEGKTGRWIDKKPSNPVGTEEENQCRKSQVYLGFLLLVVNQSLLRPVVHRVTLFAIHHHGQGYV